MKILDTVGSGLTTVSFFPDRINIPSEFGTISYDDNELLKFKQDEFGRYSIIELSKVPYINYDYYNWNYKGFDADYKWSYISPSGSTQYFLYNSGTIFPYSIPYGDSQWNIVNEYLNNTNNVGYFKQDTFIRTDIFIDPTGWVTKNNIHQNTNYYNVILQNQYRPIRLKLGTDRTGIFNNTSGFNYIEGEDITIYKENKKPVLDKNPTNSTQKLQYYLDGKNVITNYNFSDDNMRKNVHVEYDYTISKLKLVAKLNTNKNGHSDYTPVISNYVLKVSTQRLNK
jgi:hypothetical protein